MFQMRLLIFAHGNMGRLVEQNVGSLQHGIDEQANAGTLEVLACLVLELRHATEPTHPRGSIQKPGQFSMAGTTATLEKEETTRSITGTKQWAARFPTLREDCITSVLTVENT